MTREPQMQSLPAINLHIIRKLKYFLKIIKKIGWYYDPPSEVQGAKGLKRLSYCSIGMYKTKHNTNMIRPC